MQTPEIPTTSRPPYRDIAIVVVLIVGVCCFTLTPTLYLLFRALQWEKAVRVVEAIFPPVLLLFGVAALFTYRRYKARRAAQVDKIPPSARS